jgi:hypothetical protein
LICWCFFHRLDMNIDRVWAAGRTVVSHSCGRQYGLMQWFNHFIDCRFFIMAFWIVSGHLLVSLGLLMWFHFLWCSSSFCILPVIVYNSLVIILIMDISHLI